MPPQSVASAATSATGVTSVFNTGCVFVASAGGAPLRSPRDTTATWCTTTPHEATSHAGDSSVVPRSTIREHKRQPRTRFPTAARRRYGTLGPRAATETGEGTRRSAAKQDGDGAGAGAEALASSSQPEPTYLRSDATAQQKLSAQL